MSDNTPASSNMEGVKYLVQEIRKYHAHLVVYSIHSFKCEIYTMSDTVEHDHSDIILGTKFQLSNTHFIFTVSIIKNANLVFLIFIFQSDFLQLFVVRSLLSAYPSKPLFGSDTFPIINHSLFRFMFSSHFY